jgi:crotonobetainyl-CoA:carnitine CoA-transferase CaiB-like acyl-CoA transferase
VSPALLPYSGIRVLDLGQGLAAPYCGMLLAQWGAEVIKVEPAEGDWIRHIGEAIGAHSATSIVANRGKRSIVADLKQPEAVAAVRRLARTCDVVLESFRPGVAHRLGLGWQELSAGRDDLVYLSVSGYGQSGPRSQLAGSDSVLQAYSGMMVVNADTDGTPRRVGFLAVDTFAGLYAFQAVAAALHARLAGQGGRYLDLSLMACAAAVLAPQLVGAGLGHTPAPLAVPSGTYRAQDGYLTIAVSKERQFESLCAALGRPELAVDVRYRTFQARGEHAQSLRLELQRAFGERSAAHWAQELQCRGLLASPVNTLQQWLQEPEPAQAMQDAVLEGGATVRVPGIPGAPVAEGSRQQVPRVGGSAGEVLRAAGFGQEEIAGLIGRGLLA